MSVTMAMARMSAGNESTMSITRIEIMSVQPRAKPAMAPMRAPRRMAKPTTTRPMTAPERKYPPEIAGNT